MRFSLATGALSLWILACALRGTAVAETGDAWRRFAEGWPKADASGRQALVLDLVAEAKRQGGVLHSGDAVTFLYVAPIAGKSGGSGGGSARKLPKVEIDGDFTGWRFRVPLVRFADSPVHTYRLAGLPADARVEYKLYVGGRGRLDPLNATRVPNGMGGENSVVAMPGYHGVEVASGGHLAGTLERFPWKSRIEGTRRQVSVYLPASYHSNRAQKYPVVYFHDGSECLRYGHAAQIIESLQRDGRIQEVIAVFVDPRNRWRDYSRNPQFARMFVTELVPMIDGRYRTRREPASRCVVGASLGGLIAMHLAFNHPEVFGLVASQSGAFQWPEPGLVQEFAAAERKPLKIHLDAGMYELYDFHRSLLDQSREMRKVLEAKGYPLQYHEFSGGHNFTSWRDQFPAMLEYFFPKEK